MSNRTQDRAFCDKIRVDMNTVLSRHVRNALGYQMDHLHILIAANDFQISAGVSRLSGEYLADYRRRIPRRDAWQTWQNFGVHEWDKFLARVVAVDSMVAIVESCFDKSYYDCEG